MYKRRGNLFEKLIFFIAAIVAFAGFYSINNASVDGDWLKLITLFTWLSTISILILVATKENLKSELTKITEEHIIETKMLKNVHDDVLAELKLLRDDLKKKH